LVVTRALPIAIHIAWRRCIHQNKKQELSFWTHKRERLVVIGLVGFATKMHMAKSIALFRVALAECHDIVIDVSQTRAIDPRFFGLLLMLRKQLKEGGKLLRFTGVSKRTKRIFRLNGFEFLLKPDHSLPVADPAREMSN
jgi:N-acetylglucosaminyldiphosphoundecaprenol N-acetyl-beta-D-mannosaminyltransferase